MTIEQKESEIQEAVESSGEKTLAVWKGGGHHDLGKENTIAQ